MLYFLPAPLKGVINFIVLVINTLVHCIPLFVFAALKLIPSAMWQSLCTRVLLIIAKNWISVNTFMLAITQRTRYNITGDTALNNHGWYMVIANHQSWADILILQKIFNHQIPFFKFFLKQQLIYVPIIGLCWWALDFPFMRRYSKAFLAKHPELAGKDLEATRKSCEKFKTVPVSIMNFVEGTRFTPAKHAQQQSPYQYLLKPKSAGLAYAIDIMHEEIDTLVDVTICYADRDVSFWQFLQGKISAVDIHIQARHIPTQLASGDYSNDAVFRAAFQSWVSQIWQEKDAQMRVFSTKQH